jgi:hypothetical protein
VSNNNVGGGNDLFLAIVIMGSIICTLILCICLIYSWKNHKLIRAFFARLQCCFVFHTRRPAGNRERPEIIVMHPYLHGGDGVGGSRSGNNSGGDGDGNFSPFNSVEQYYENELENIALEELHIYDEVFSGPVLPDGNPPPPPGDGFAGGAVGGSVSIEMKNLSSGGSKSMENLARQPASNPWRNRAFTVSGAPPAIPTASAPSAPTTPNSALPVRVVAPLNQTPAQPPDGYIFPTPHLFQTPVGLQGAWPSSAGLPPLSWAGFAQPPPLPPLPQQYLANPPPTPTAGPPLATNTNPAPQQQQNNANNPKAQPGGGAVRRPPKQPPNPPRQGSYGTPPPQIKTNLLNYTTPVSRKPQSHPSSTNQHIPLYPTSQIMQQV